MKFQKYFHKFIIKGIIRGYKIFKKEKLLNNYYQLELDIEEYINNQSLNNIIYHQYLYRMLISHRVKYTYLFFLGFNARLCYPIPFQWFHLFKKNDVKINYTLSFICFLFLSIVFIMKSLLSLFKILLIKKSYLVNYDKYDVIINIPNNNYLPNKNNQNYNLIDYIIKEFNVNFNIFHSLKHQDIVRGRYKINYINNFFPLTFIQKIYLFFFALYQILIFLLKLFILKFNNIFLFNEIIINKQVKLFNTNNNLASNYFFIFPTVSFRPIWTYFAESQKSNIFYINYSSGFYGLKNIITNQYPKQIGFGLKCMTWNNYIVDKQIYFNFLQTTYPDKSFILSNNLINLSDSGQKITNIDNGKYTIALFDVSPIRKFLRIGYLPQDSFRETEIAIQFLNDIHDLKIKYDLNILFKKKRDQISRDCKRYHNFVKHLTFHQVDPKVSSARLASFCDLIISVPFTTTAFNKNKYNNINSVFYSPMKIVSNSDRASQNLPIISGKKNLENFLINQIKVKSNVK